MLKDEQCTETVTRDDFCFQRYCPHAGEDLTFATIENGTIECPRHHWIWDLKAGECIKGGNLKLKVEKVPGGTLVSRS